MGKTLIILFTALIFSGCAGKTIENNKPANIAAQNTNANTKPANNNANSAANTNGSIQNLSAEKIDKPLEINFKDGLPKGWEWIDPEKDTKYETKESGLNMKILGGKDLYVGNFNAPRLLKAVSGDFEIETRVKFDPKESYQGAGILIYKSDDDFLRLERGFGGIGGGESGVRLDRQEKGGYDTISSTEKFPTEAKQVDLKIVRKGKEFRAFWRENEDGEWKLVGEYSADYPEAVKIGLIGVNTATEITADFAYIKIAPVTK